MNSSCVNLETRDSLNIVDRRSGRIRFDLPDESGSAPTWSLVIFGDWVPQVRFLAAGPENMLNLLGDLLTVLQEAELAVFDLECVTADEEPARAVRDGSFGKAPYWGIQLLTDWEAF